jgi:hypothetical protein
MKCVFLFSLQVMSEEFIVLSRTEREIKNVYWSTCKVPVILVGFYWNLTFLDIFLNNSQISNLMKVRPVGAE